MVIKSRYRNIYDGWYREIIFREHIRNHDMSLEEENFFRELNKANKYKKPTFS